MWRERLEIDEDAFVVLSSRLVRPNYNIDTIIRAFALVRRQVESAVLVLKEVARFADAEYRRHCVALVEELELGDAVRTVGELSHDDLVSLYPIADVYLSVPQNDATAVSVFEAMGAGVPVVASDVPGVDPEILRHGETALLVTPGDVDALASAVIALSRESRLRQSIAQSARETAERYGDFNRELDRAVELYEQLVAARRYQP
jgi:glycosyltransferase involved in cell wall biosynthesis